MKKTSSTKKPRKSSSFVLRLFRLLANPDTQSVISWDQLGTGFIIHNIRLFEDYLLRSYFKNNNINSFFRQLNLYNFKRTTDARKLRESGYISWCHFQHPLFTRDKPEDLPLVRRQPIKTNTKDNNNENIVLSSGDPSENLMETSSNNIQPIVINSNVPNWQWPTYLPIYPPYLPVVNNDLNTTMNLVPTWYLTPQPPILTYPFYDDSLFTSFPVASYSDPNITNPMFQNPTFPPSQLPY